MNDWRDRAPCRGLTHLFFPNVAPPGRRGHPAGHDPYQQARGICSTCPTRQQCSDYADTNRIIDGMWGGQDPQQRWTQQHQHGTCHQCGTTTSNPKFCTPRCKGRWHRQRNVA